MTHAYARVRHEGLQDQSPGDAISEHGEQLLNDNKPALTLAYMASHTKERTNTSRALANLGDRHELILKALQEGYSFREVAESLKQHEGIDVSTETIRRHYSPLVGRASKKRKRAAAIDTARALKGDPTRPATEPRAKPTPEPPAKPTSTATSTHAGIVRAGRRP